jgi:hypothetical protein
MIQINPIEMDNLMHLNPSLSNNGYEGVMASERANNNDKPMNNIIKVHEACEKSYQNNLADIMDTVELL